MPAMIYTLKNGERVPGVTTVLGNLGWKTHGLVHWAHKLGREGKDLDAEREALANAGTLAHLWASLDIRKQPRPELPEWATPEIVEKAGRSFASYLNWKAQTRLELVASEVAMVSEAHGFGGCIDLVGVVDGEVDILDFKSSKRLYDEQVVQLAAYRMLWQENHPDLPVKRVRVMRWGEDGDTHESIFPNTDNAWRVFLHALAIHQLKKNLKAA